MISRSDVIIDIAIVFFFSLLHRLLLDCGDNTRDWHSSDDEKTAEGERVENTGRKLFAELGIFP